MKYLKLTIIVLVLFTTCKPKTKDLQTKQLEETELDIAKTINPENEWIHRKIDSTIKANNIPALSVGVIRDGKLAYVEGFGYLKRDSNIKVDENTLFQIGSDTKKFTGIIVNNLVSEGKLKLEEPITSYLKNELSSEGERKIGGITLNILLHHKSGIPNREPSNERIDGDPMLIPFTEENMIKDLNILELDFEPGEKFSYSNFGYAIVGYICEKVSGQDYSALVKKYVTNKYNMPNTVDYPSIEQSKLIAIPYRKDHRNVESKPWTMGKMTPAGGIYSNIKDLSNLMLAQVRAYQKLYEKGDKIDPLILTEENSDTNEGQYGFGLGKSVDDTGVRYGHGGDLDGYASGYVFLPKKDLGLIMLTSSGGQWFGQLEKQIRIELITNKVK